MRFAADEATAKRVSDMLFEQLDPDEAAVSAFEGLQGWLVEVHLAHEPDRARLTELVRQAAGENATPEFSQVEDKDWVAASLRSRGGESRFS